MTLSCGRQTHVLMVVGLIVLVGWCVNGLADEAGKAQGKEGGPKVISDSVVPLPPHYYEEMGTVAGEGANENEDSSEDKTSQEESVKLEGCVQYDDSICGMKCNPPVQDVGERCAQYEKRPDGICVCKVCEKVDCGGG